MKEINIKPGVVRDVARDLNKYSGDLGDLSQKLLKIEENIRFAWKGAYVEEYIACIEKTRRKIENMEGSLQQTQKSLYDTARTVEEAEKKLNSIMGGFGGNGRGGGGGGGNHGGFR